MDALLVLLISVLTPWVLERLKYSRWFPFMQPFAPVLNRLTPLVVAAITAAGVTVGFDQGSGVLTVGGLVPSDVIRGLLLWGAGALTQQVSYKRAIEVRP